MTPLKPLFDMTFDKVEKGVHIFSVQALKKVDKDDKGRTRLDLQCKVEGGVCDGYSHTEFFYIKNSKNDNFGQVRFLGWFCSAFPDRAKDEFSDDLLIRILIRSLKEQRAFSMGVM